jgi:hypothetical protein
MAPQLYLGESGCGSVPNTQNSCEFQKLGTHSHPFSVGKLAVRALFEAGAPGSFELPLPAVAITTYLHVGGMENGICVC